MILDKLKSVLKELKPLLIKFVVVVALLWATLTYVFGVFRLSGNNMYPALRDGDLCVTYKMDDYYSGDIVAYNILQDGNDTIKFGRIIAVYGDTVDGDESGLIINGGPAYEEIFYATDMLDTCMDLPYSVNNGEIIVMNDYRMDKNDSRTYGAIKPEQLKGKVIFILRRRGF